MHKRRKKNHLDLLDFFSPKTKFTAKTVTECSHITLECRVRAQNDLINDLHLITNKENTFMKYKGVKNAQNLSKLRFWVIWDIFSPPQWSKGVFMGKKILLNKNNPTLC